LLAAVIQPNPTKHQTENVNKNDRPALAIGSDRQSAVNSNLQLVNSFAFRLGVLTLKASIVCIFCDDMYVNLMQ
jgi:hypothetical protein